MDIYMLYLTVKETFLWKKTVTAITWSIIFQFVFFSTFVFFANFDVLHPFSSIVIALRICLSIKSFLTILPLSAIIFAQCFACSRQYFTVPSCVETRFARLLHFLAPSNLVYTLLYMLIGGTIPITYQLPFEGGYDGLIKKCHGSGRYICMNEGGVFLVLNGLWIGLFFSVQNYFCESNMIVFPVVQQRIFLHIKSGLNPILKQAFVETFCPTVYFIVFHYWQGPVIREFIASLLGVIAEDSVYDTSYGLCHVKLIAYSWFFAAMFVITMNMMKLVLKIYLTQHVKFPVASLYSNDPVLILHQAITCVQIPIIQYLGYYDLRILSEKDASRRQELFSLSVPGGHPFNWNLIVEECISFLKKYTQSLNEASGEKLVAEKRILSDVQPPIFQNLTNPVLNMSLMHSSQLHSPINTSQYSTVYPSPNMKYMQSPIRRLETSLSEKQVLHSMTTPREPAQDIVRDYYNHFLEALCKKPGISYLFSDIPDAKVRYHLRQGQLVVWVVQSLSLLVAASYKEDKYGVVQKDLVTIITTLLQLKLTLDKLQKIGNYKKTQKADNQDLKMKTALRSSVRYALYRISITFGKHIKELQLGKETAQQIQNFMLFREA